MFKSDYLEFESKADKRVKEIVSKSIEIYKILENKKIYYYSHSMEKSMDIVDKYSFATLIAILDSDKKLNDYFKRYSITIEKIIDYLDIDLTDALKLYPDQLESEFIHGYGSFLQKITNTYEWKQIDIINLVDNVIYEYRDDSDAIKSFFKDNNISISDVSKGLLNLDEEDFLEDIKQNKEKTNLTGFGYYLTGDIGKNIKGREKEIRDLEASLIAPGKLELVKQQ